MLKFMVVAVTAYGMATLEGPTLAIKSVNALSHYTRLDDRARAHRRAGLERLPHLQRALLDLFPRLYNTKLWSTKLANYHFWIALLGMVFYVVPMYVAGVTEGMMWKQFNKDGFLQYPNFLEVVQAILPMYMLRAVGGTLYIIGVGADGVQPLQDGQERAVRAGSRKPRPRRSRAKAPARGHPSTAIAGWKPSR